MKLKNTEKKRKLVKFLTNILLELIKATQMFNNTDKFLLNIH